MKAEHRIIIKKKEMARPGQALSASEISAETKAIAAVLDDIFADIKNLRDNVLTEEQKKLIGKLRMAVELNKL